MKYDYFGIHPFRILEWVIMQSLYIDLETRKFSENTCTLPCSYLLKCVCIICCRMCLQPNINTLPWCGRLVLTCVTRLHTMSLSMSSVHLGLSVNITNKIHTLVQVYKCLHLTQVYSLFMIERIKVVISRLLKWWWSVAILRFWSAVGNNNDNLFITLNYLFMLF